MRLLGALTRSPGERVHSSAQAANETNMECAHEGRAGGLVAPGGRISRPSMSEPTPDLEVNGVRLGATRCLCGKKTCYGEQEQGSQRSDAHFSSGGSESSEVAEARTCAPHRSSL
ncbi:MAG: hypothetical protein JWO05_1303 [Gemmatimonadetes bacterium]|nr:hypothetical protein [Gemmatimonadota bacterium]